MLKSTLISVKTWKSVSRQCLSRRTLDLGALQVLGNVSCSKLKDLDDDW